MTSWMVLNVILTAICRPIFGKYRSDTLVNPEKQIMFYINVYIQLKSTSTLMKVPSYKLVAS